MTTAPEHPMTPEVSATESLAPARTAPDGNAAGTTDGAGIDAAAGGSPAAALLAGHKGKLAIGVAATLGLMVYYGWREKRLAQTDPEEYARLQRIKAGLRSNADWPAPEDDGVGDAAPGDLPEADARQQGVDRRTP